MIRRVRESSGVVSRDSGAIGEGVVGRADAQVICSAPCRAARVYDHLAVSSDVRCDVTVAGEPIVLPAAPNVG